MTKPEFQAAVQEALRPFSNYRHISTTDLATDIWPIVEAALTLPPKPAIAPGAVVRLRSSMVEMTVNEPSFPPDDQRLPKTLWRCSWFDDEKHIQWGHFDASALVFIR